MKNKEFNEYIDEEVSVTDLRELKKYYKRKRKIVFIYIPIFVAILLGVLITIGIVDDISIGISTIKEGITDGTKLWGLGVLAYYGSILIIIFFNTFIKGWLGLILSAIPIINFIYFAFLLVYYAVGAGIFGGLYGLLAVDYFNLHQFVLYLGWIIGFTLFFSFEKYVSSIFDDFLMNNGK